jgi:hypothetical protein
MKRKMISQREARALKRRVDELESMIQRQRSTYAATYPGGTHLGDVFWDSANHTASAVYTAQRLGHAVVAVSDGQMLFHLYALPHKDMPV